MMYCVRSVIEQCKMPQRMCYIYQRFEFFSLFAARLTPSLVHLPIMKDSNSGVSLCVNETDACTGTNALSSINCDNQKSPEIKHQFLGPLTVSRVILALHDWK